MVMQNQLKLLPNSKTLGLIVMLLRNFLMNYSVNTEQKPYLQLQKIGKN